MKKKNPNLFATRPNLRIPVLVGRMKKLKNMSPEKQAAAPDYADPSSPGKRKKQQKMKSQMPEQKASAAAVYASTSPAKKKSKKEKKMMKKKGGERMQDEKRQDEAADEKPVANGNEDRGPSLYLVVQHAVQCPSYSLFEVMHTQMTAEHPVPFPNRIEYFNAAHNMTFVALSSATRSWIVGAGGSRGDQGQTIVIDCRTGAVAKGPSLTESKFCPVVVAVGEKVYALSRMPSLWMPPDFPPWFEVLDLSGASCVDGQLTNCTWYPLPHPPFSPNLRDGWSRVDRGPPTVEVESYVVIAHYILLSIVSNPFTEQDAGTVAFDTITEKWLDLDPRNLPFVGQAVPYGRLFLGRSKSKDWNYITAYNITVTKPKKSTTLMLSVMEVPVTVGMTNGTPLTSGQFFASLGNGVICVVGCSTESSTGYEEIERDNIYMNFHSPIDGEQAGKIVLSSSPSKYFFRLHEPTFHLITPSLVAAPCLTLI